MSESDYEEACRLKDERNEACGQVHLLLAVEARARATLDQLEAGANRNNRSEDPDDGDASFEDGVLAAVASVRHALWPEAPAQKPLPSDPVTAATDVVLAAMKLREDEVLSELRRNYNLALGDDRISEFGATMAGELLDRVRAILRPGSAPAAVLTPEPATVKDGLTVAAAPRCQCTYEAGDSPCPVHGDDAAAPRVEPRRPQVGDRFEHVEGDPLGFVTLVEVSAPTGHWVDNDCRMRWEADGNEQGYHTSFLLGEHGAGWRAVVASPAAPAVAAPAVCVATEPTCPLCFQPRVTVTGWSCKHVFHGQPPLPLDALHAEGEAPIACVCGGLPCAHEDNDGPADGTALWLVDCACRRRTPLYRTREDALAAWRMRFPPPPVEVKGASPGPWTWRQGMGPTDGHLRDANGIRVAVVELIDVADIRLIVDAWKLPALQVELAEEIAAHDHFAQALVAMTDERDRLAAELAEERTKLLLDKLRSWGRAARSNRPGEPSAAWYFDVAQELEELAEAQAFPQSGSGEPPGEDRLGMPVLDLPEKATREQLVENIRALRVERRALLAEREEDRADRLRLDTEYLDEALSLVAELEAAQEAARTVGLHLHLERLHAGEFEVCPVIICEIARNGRRAALAPKPGGGA